MRFYRLRLFACLLAVTTAFAFAARPSHATPLAIPSALPGLPATLPPPVVGVSPASPEPHVGGVSYALARGWNSLSFPLSSVLWASGFGRAVYLWTPRGYMPQDLLHAPRQMDTGRACLLWADRPHTVLVRGTTTARPASLRLEPGWNLIGCPTRRALPWRSVVFTREGGVSGTAPTVAGEAAAPSSAWVFASVLSGRRGWMDIRAAGQTMLAGDSVWIYAWHRLRLNWNVTPPARRPHVAWVYPAVLVAGQVAEVHGRGFGTPGDALLMVGGVLVPPSDVLTWTPGRIRFRVPAGITRGTLVVMVGRYPSNAVAVRARTPVRPGFSTLRGRVYSLQGRPIARAQVMLEDGQMALTANNGTFTIAPVRPGLHQAYISAAGYREVCDEVHLAPHRDWILHAILEVATMQSPSPGVEPRATLWVGASGRRIRGRRIWVKSIGVWEYGDHAREWARFWRFHSAGGSRRWISASNARVGRIYVIRVTWGEAGRPDRSSMSFRRLTGPTDTVHLDYP